MYYDVLSADGREAVSAMFADTFRETRRIGGEFQVGAIDLDKRRERRQSDEAVEFCDDRLAPLYVVAKLDGRSEEHTSELQSLMRISYAVFCLKKKRNKTQ